MVLNYKIITWSASVKLAVVFPGFSFVTWLVLCSHQPIFLSRVLLLGVGKLLSVKKKCHCCFVVMCVGFTMNCQNKSQSKSLPPDIHMPFLHVTTHRVRSDCSTGWPINPSGPFFCELTSGGASTAASCIECGN